MGCETLGRLDVRRAAMLAALRAYRSMGQPHPYRKRGPALSNFGGSLLIIHIPLSQDYQICRGNTCRGVACILGVSHASHPKRAESQRSPILGVLYLCYTSFNAEQPNSAR